MFFLEGPEVANKFSDPHVDINRLFQLGLVEKDLLDDIAKTLISLVGGFVPDFIITWTPAPFLNVAYPHAIVLHKEISMFQRSPYSPCYALDPIGYYGKSLLSKKIEEWKGLKNVDEQKYTEEVRTQIDARIKAVSPFSREISILRKRFQSVWLLPLQYNGYWSIDSFIEERSQFDIAEKLLHSTPDDIAIIITRHAYSSITDVEINYLLNKYSNAIYLKDVERYRDASDLILPLVDGVATVTSTLALKAIFHKKKVVSLGVSYLGWLDDGCGYSGIVDAMVREERPEKQAFIAWMSFNYMIPLKYEKQKGTLLRVLNTIKQRANSGGVDSVFDRPLFEPEQLFKYLLEGLSQQLPRYADKIVSSGSGQLVPNQGESLKLQPAEGSPTIIFFYASGRWNASGYYLQDLSVALVNLGFRCVIVAEGELPSGGEESGVQWLNYEWEGALLSRRLKRKLIALNPDYCFAINVRLNPMRAALEMLISTGCKICVQSEDDDLLIYKKFYKRPDPRLLDLVDTPKVTGEAIKEFVQILDIDYTKDLILRKKRYRDVEPVIRALCYHVSSYNFAIWNPLLEKVQKSYGKPGIVIPPVVNIEDYCYSEIAPEERLRILGKYDIDGDRFVIFIGGTIYDFSKEFEIFLQAARILGKKHKIAVVTTGRSRVDLSTSLAKSHGNGVSIHAMEKPGDDDYLAMMRAADLIAAPGVRDVFNLLRLPSRLVKAMALAKPIFTFDWGFGSSLENMENAVLSSTDDPHEWADKIDSVIVDNVLRARIGRGGRDFAVEHFDAKAVAEKLATFLSKRNEAPGGLLSSPHALQNILQYLDTSRRSVLILDETNGDKLDPLVDKLTMLLSGWAVTIRRSKPLRGPLPANCRVVVKRGVSQVLALALQRFGLIIMYKHNAQRYTSGRVKTLRVLRADHKFVLQPPCAFEPWAG